MKAIGIKESENQVVQTKPMSEMKPLEVCVITSGADINHIVMRTASTEKFEVMNLTELQVDCYWSKEDAICRRVTPYKGKDIILKLG